MRTYEKCLESIRKTIYNIADVPNQYKTRELCAEALDNLPKYSDDGLFQIIGHIPYPDVLLCASAAWLLQATEAVHKNG